MLYFIGLFVISEGGEDKSCIFSFKSSDGNFNLMLDDEKVSGQQVIALSPLFLLFDSVYLLMNSLFGIKLKYPDSSNAKDWGTS